MPLADAGSVRVEWDEAKDEANRRKHGLSFADARVLLESGDCLIIFDADHSEFEDRFLAIGAIDRGIIVVAFTEPAEDTHRIISARHATGAERALYRSYMDRNP
jgi:uncharacterized DUF497 family protein